MSQRHIAVAVGVIIDDQDRVLVALRPQHVNLPGVWEFPGGKLEIGESAEQALIRELQEEVDIRIEDPQALLTVDYDYDDLHITLHTFYSHSFRGNAYGKEGQQIAWVPRQQLPELTFPPANQQILQAVLALR